MIHERNSCDVNICANHGTALIFTISLILITVTVGSFGMMPLKIKQGQHFLLCNNALQHITHFTLDYIQQHSSEQLV